MSFARILIAVWIYKTCFLGLSVNCAAVGIRQASSPDSSLQSSMQIDFRIYFLLIAADTTAGVTLVTKVVAITSFVDPQGLVSSSAASAQSDGVVVVTKVVRVGPTTVNTADCNPLLCSANVAVSDTFFLFQARASSKSRRSRFLCFIGPKNLQEQRVSRQSRICHQRRPHQD